MRLIKSKKGTTSVLFAISLAMLLGFTAAVADFGNVCVEKGNLQNAVDAAALAAAQDLPDTTKALTTANQYIQANGFTSSDVSVSFTNSNKTINITGTKAINFTFAKVLGINNTTAHVSSSASTGSIGDAFNYVLFSGSKTSTLALNGSTFTITGSSHTNKNFTANCSTINISGACEAMGTVTVNGSSININSKVPNASFVSMPDFSAAIKLQAQQSGTTYNSSKTFSGSTFNVNSPIYVNGGLTINGSSFKGNGCILTTGDINFNGSSLMQTTSDSVCFYTQSGNININCSNMEIDGIMYAPNGTITINGSNEVIHGRVIANAVAVNTSSIKIIGSSTDLASLPSSGVKLIK